MAIIIQQSVSDKMKRVINALPMTRVYHSVDQTVVNNTSVTLLMDSERFDTDNMHNLSVNKSRITFNVSGYYFIGGNVRFSSNATGMRSLSIKKNGTTAICEQGIPAVNGDATVVNTNTFQYMNAGDYVEMAVYQNSGVSLTVQKVSNEVSPEFYAIRLA